jgi:hypothetical protein
MKIWRQVGEVYYSSILIEHTFWRNLRKFLKTSTVVTQVDKICSRILWTWSGWQTCLGWYCNPQLLQPWFSTNFRTSPLPFYYNNFIAKNFSAICAQEKFVSNSLHIHLIEIVMKTQATTHCFLKSFRWKSLRGRDSMPQLVVVSGLFGGNPFVDGILGHNLLLSRTFWVGITSWMGF